MTEANFYHCVFSFPVSGQRAEIINRLADLLIERKEVILTANKRDLNRARMSMSLHCDPHCHSFYKQKKHAESTELEYKANLRNLISRTLMCSGIEAFMSM